MLRTVRPGFARCGKFAVLDRQTPRDKRGSVFAPARTTGAPEDPKASARHYGRSSRARRRSPAQPIQCAYGSGSAKRTAIIIPAVSPIRGGLSLTCRIRLTGYGLRVMLRKKFVIQRLRDRVRAYERNTDRFPMGLQGFGGRSARLQPSFVE